MSHVVRHCLEHFRQSVERERTTDRWVQNLGEKTCSVGQLLALTGRGGQTQYNISPLLHLMREPRWVTRFLPAVLRLLRKGKMHDRPNGLPML